MTPNKLIQYVINICIYDWCHQLVCIILTCTIIIYRSILHPQVLYFVAFLIPIAGVYYLAPRPTRDELESELRNQQNDKHHSITQQSVNQIKNLYQTGSNWDFKQVTDLNESKRGTMNTAVHPLHLKAQEKYSKFWIQSSGNHNQSSEHNENQVKEIDTSNLR